MRAICLTFHVHQPYRLRTYRFFNIGGDHQYYDDYQNRHIIKRIAEKSYIPANKMLLDLIREFGPAFKVSFSISGSAIEQFQQYTPEVLEGFKELARTGCVEFIGETWSHSLASLKNKEEFVKQVHKHADTIESLFGQKPQTFNNTEMIYSDQIGNDIAELGFTAMITEGAKHIMGWKSPNYVYCNAINPKLKVLLRNFRMSDDLIFRFSNRAWSEWPLTAEKFVSWLNLINPREEVVNIGMNYDTLGEQQPVESGIFEFFKSLPGAVLTMSPFKFSTPSEVSMRMQTVSAISVNYPLSWADEEKDLTAWLGNELQNEAFEKVYSLASRVKECHGSELYRDWERLQTSDHFYYMSTKWFSDGDVHKYFNPYPSPYEAFINYMNVLSDFMIRLDECKPGKHDSIVKPAEKVKIAPIVKETKKEKSTQVKPVIKKVSFFDLIHLSDKKLRQVLAAVEEESLFIAMKGCDEEITGKITRNLGKRALKKYESYGRNLKNIKTAEVKKHRRAIEKELKKVTDKK